ncbi:MAG: hypothetical protein JWP08_1483 [Bryobacterales bacterium]|nr:hypothetical protein [Bryobacterales bacterium]
MQHQPYRCGIRLTRTLTTSLVLGAATTVAVAWGCAMWSPKRTTSEPFPNPKGIADTVDPDGVVGLHDRESGLGWVFMSLRGQRFMAKAKEDVFWGSPYGGVYHRVAGWPLPALRSRVEVVDSQGSSRFSEGEPEPEGVTQRRRWDLPAREIVYRGIATKDLPDWSRAYSGRRLPLVPMVLGFAVDTLAYGIAFALLAGGCSIAWRRLRAARRGLAVITEGAA